MAFKRLATHDADVPFVEASHVTVRYNGRAALDDLSFLLSAGERIAVVMSIAPSRACLPDAPTVARVEETVNRITIKRCL